jgi:hypothetical protein
MKIEGKEIILPDKFKEVIEGAAVICDSPFDEDKRLVVTIEREFIKCKAEKKKTFGWLEKKIPFAWKGLRPVSFVINPNFLSQVLDHSSTMIIGDMKVIFKSENFEHLISLFPDKE